MNRCDDCPGDPDCPPCLSLDDKLAKELLRRKPRTNAEIIDVVEDVLRDFGLDHEHWEEVSEIRQDLNWVRDTRRRCDVVKGKTFGTIIGAIVTGILVLLTIGFNSWIGK